MNTSNHSVDILHVVPAYWPRAGGVETLVASMIAGLRNEHRVTGIVVTPRRLGDPHDEISHEGINVIPISILQSDRTEDQFKTVHKAFAGMRKIYERYQPKLVHIHAYSEISLPACIVARSSGIPYLLHVHGLLNSTLPPSYIKEVGEAGHVIAVSQAVANSITSMTGRTKPVSVIPNGIRHINQDGIILPKDIHQPPTILMIGRLEENKGFEDGLKAISAVIKSGKNVRAVIVGRGELGPTLSRLATDLGISNLVEFKGEIGYLETQSLISSASILLVPSREIEGFSLVSLEAALLETPVIASDVGGIPETVKHDYSGILVAPRDIDGFAEAILKYIENPGLAKKHGVQARQRAMSLFKLELFLSRWMDEYQRILEHGIKVKEVNNGAVCQ